eukprot:scaffold271876_cov18-Tisochrysis_lutea.AAC.1
MWAHNKVPGSITLPDVVPSVRCNAHTSCRWPSPSGHRVTTRTRLAGFQFASWSGQPELQQPPWSQVWTTPEKESRTPPQARRLLCSHHAKHRAVCVAATCLPGSIRPAHT